MKHFNYYLLHLVAFLFMATTVYAQCDIIYDTGAYEVMTSTSSSKPKTFTIDDPRPCAQLTFTNDQNKTWATGGVQVTATYTDGSTEVLAGASASASNTFASGTHTIYLNQKIVKSLTFKGTGTLKKTISNISLTQAHYITPQLPDNTLYLTQIGSNTHFAGMFQVAWSTCHNPITLTCDNPYFRITPTSFDTAQGFGTFTCTCTCTPPDTLPLTATLTISDQVLSTTVTLSATASTAPSCRSFALYVTDLQTITLTSPTKTFPISGLPADTMTFIAHAEILSANNDLTIDFSRDGSTWTNTQVIPIAMSTAHSTYSCLVPDSAAYVRFTTSSTLRTYFDMVTIRQQEFITPSLSEIIITDAIVNQPYHTTFSIDYSDVPLIQHHVTNLHNLNPLLTLSPEVTNDCGSFGTCTCTCTLTSPYPQTVTDTITIFTSAGHNIKIPITITATLGETYYFNQSDGLWSDLSLWRLADGSTPTALPSPSNPVLLSHHAIIDQYEATPYSITIDNGALTVMPQGGLTVHAGGFTGANANNLTLHNTRQGAGFIRISPYFTREVTGTMPTIKVLYQTRSTLDTGANKDATWQYIGAAGYDCQFTVDYITWLYHWSESQGWINKTGTLTLTPFAGYAITQYGQPTYELPTTPIHSNQTLTLTKTTTNNGMNGDNLFANSFTAPIDVKNFTPEDFSGEIDKTFYIFNSGSWNQWNGHLQQGDTIGDNKSMSPGQYCAIPALAAPYLDSDYDITTIPPMQGVYVVAKDNNAQIHLNYTKHIWQAGTSTTDMNESMRLPQRTDNTTSTHNSLIRLRIHVRSLNSGADRMYIIQDTLTTPDYDNGYDAPNQMGEGLVNIYTNEHFGQMEVSCSNHIDSMFIGFTAGEDSIYTLTFNALIGENIYIQDLENDSIILLSEDGCYTFNATPQTTNDMRFQVLLHPNINNNQGNNDDIISSTTDIPSAQIWSYGKSIYIANVPANSTATLYNVGGQALLTTPIHYTPYILNLSHLPNGIYILKMNNDVYKFVCK